MKLKSQLKISNHDESGTEMIKNTNDLLCSGSLSLAITNVYLKMEYMSKTHA